MLTIKVRKGKSKTPSAQDSAVDDGLKACPREISGLTESIPQQKERDG